MRSHPVTRQDEWVLQNSTKPGYFVEVGAHDGLRHSNTIQLEQHGWTGLLVEPNPELYAQCVKNRPNCRVISQAVTYGEGLLTNTASFILGDAYGGLVQYMRHEWLKGHLERGHQRIQVPVTTLTKLLDECQAPRQIDYLSLDTEGSEYAILKQFVEDGEPYHIRLITVEFCYDGVLLKQFCNLLSNYDLAEIRGWDACFVRAL